jgi:hypothetical protein
LNSSLLMRPHSEIRLIQKGERYRVIPMTAEIEAILRPLRDHDKIVARSRQDTCVHVCCEAYPQGQWGNKFIRGERYPVTYWGIKTARQRDYPKAGFGMIGFHDLRRTAAKRMSVGCPLYLQHRKGCGIAANHSDIVFTTAHDLAHLDRRLPFSILSGDQALSSLIGNATNSSTTIQSGGIVCITALITSIGGR